MLAKLLSTPTRSLLFTVQATSLSFRSQRVGFCSTTIYRMPLNDPEAKNAAGLVPHESKSLGERQPEAHEESILDGLKQLYTSSPSQSAYSIYSNDATFHDPIGIAEGLESIKAQFNGLAKLFPRAEIPRFRLLENPASVPKSIILIDQDVAYFRDPKASSPTKIVNSLLTLETNNSHKVTRHTEEWDHKRETDSSDGFFGMLNEQRKKITAGITSMFVSSDAGKN
ncbi:hypothetical protein QCA50_002226 [Cerrena zonata]|uniref:Uncharacterized protein n=1 Tax=Cerrena zonata TaxID=2478898 RepID=A0AAW0GN24_9APHY